MTTSPITRPTLVAFKSMPSIEGSPWTIHTHLYDNGVMKFASFNGHIAGEYGEIILTDVGTSFEEFFKSIEKDADWHIFNTLSLSF